MIKRTFFVVVFLVSPAFGVIIDDFSVGPTTLTVDWDNQIDKSFQDGLDSGAVIGGRRVLSLSFASVSQTEQAVLTVDTTTQTLSLDANVSLGGHSVRWGRSSNDPGSFAVELNANLLADGSDAFRIDVMASAVSQTLRLSLSSGVDEGVPSADGTGVFFPATDVPFSVRLPFLFFPDVDFTDVDFIYFGDTNVYQGRDFTLDAIRTVPEPSALVTFILGLIGVMWIRHNSA